MTTRFYLSQTIASPLGTTLPVADASWETTASIIRRKMTPEKMGSGLTSTAVASTGVGPYDSLRYQWCSQALAAGGTLSGPFSYVFRVSESSSLADYYTQVVLRVIKPDGTVRGVAFSGHTATAVVATSGAVNEEWPVTAATRIGNAIAFTSSVAYLAGDYIVAEVGYRRCVATATSYTGSINAGDPDDGTADFTLVAGLTTTLVPWIELADTLTFVPPTARLIRDAADVLLEPSIVATRLTRTAVDVMVTSAGPSGWGRVVR